MRRRLIAFFPLLPAVLWASLTFAALFLFIGAAFRRPAVVAIIYSFCLETVLGNLPGYLKRLSVSFYARCMMAERASQYGIETERSGVYLPVDGTTALVVLIGAAATLVVVGAVSGAVGCFVILRGLSFTGESLAHTVLPGLVVAYALGVSLLLGAAALAAVTVLIALLARHDGRISDVPRRLLPRS